MTAQPIRLTQAAYTARSVIAEAQRCLNLYPEANPEDAPFPFTFYPTPGLTLQAEAPSSETTWRCLYRASNGELFGVLDTNVYYIDSNYVLTLLGTITAARTNTCYMADNGTTIILVDGSTTSLACGWSIVLATHAFAAIADADFLGGDRIDYIDTFFVANQPGTRNWYKSDANAITFTGTDVGTKTGGSDDVATLVCSKREVWLLGDLTSEIWFNDGNDGFPFVPMPSGSGFIEHGCAAKYSVAQSDVSVFWLGQDDSGQKIVFEGIGYEARRVSTHAVEVALGGYSTVSDAVGFCYQQEGHVFYVLAFPTADKTWVYDLNTKLWHERAWIDTDGDEHCIRYLCAAFAYGANVVGDRANGNLYTLELGVYTDNDDPVVRRRGFPHLVNGAARVIYNQFIADIEVGTITTAGTPLVSLRYSDDRGVSWSATITQSLGATGEYRTSVQWNRLGMARDRVFELFWSVDAKVAINGAWVRPTPAMT